MFTNFQPSSFRRYLVTTRALRRFCKRACSVEEMALFWCTDTDKSILVSKLEGDSTTVQFAFYIKKRFIGSVLAHKDTLLRKYPEYSPLDETLYYFSDQDGARPNDPWFEERSERLQINYSYEHQINCAPAFAVPELVLSYVFSSSGFAEIRCLEGETLPRALHVNLIFLGQERGAGWSEEFRVSRKELLDLVHVNKQDYLLVMH